MRLVSKLRGLLQNLLASSYADAELDSELRSHLDLLTQEKIRAGLPPE